MPPVWVIVLAAVAVILLGLILMVARFYRKVDQGQALIVNRMKTVPDVYFTGAVVLPIVHRAEVMDIALKTIELERHGKDGLICADNIRADIKVSFYLRVNPTADSVMRVAQTIGVRRASDQQTLETLFLARFSEALKTVGKRMDFEQLYQERHKWKDEIIEVMGNLNGYILEEAAIDYLEQTSLEHMDPQNILDAQGIRKITELTTLQNVMTNELKQTERKAIKKENVSAEEALMELERQEADARAKQQREIAVMKAREDAETLSVQAEEEKRAALARIRAEEEVAIQNEARLRQVEVAQKNRERVVGIESERVDKDQQLEAIVREREVELARIEKEKQLEVQKKEIADVVSKRVAVDREVAEQEELIKDLVANSGAKREADVKIIAAEADAQEGLVRDLKKAEALQEASKFRAKEQLTLAEAELAVADKAAAAEIRRAEGTQAAAAAEGLARVKVKEADAHATEVQGEAEAKVIREKGLAAVAVRQAESEAIEQVGLAQAKVVREQKLAEAQGDEGIGLAEVKVRVAEAGAIEKMGLAEAEAIKQKLTAEAVGLAEKASAMKALDGVGREHEEFRIQLEMEKEVKLEHIRIQRHIADSQAQALKAAFETANIQIVGGDGAFFDKMMGAITLGRSFDGAIENSDTLKTLAADYLSGDASLPADLKQVLTKPAIDSGTLQNLSVAALLAKLARGEDSNTQAKLEALLTHAKKLGLDKFTLG
ncbi:MAG: putative membrane protein YqiK [Myxococcota bacterium]|jgi:uncharacterized membrane protein YqiK